MMNSQVEHRTEGRKRVGAGGQLGDRCRDQSQEQRHESEQRRGKSVQGDEQEARAGQEDGGTG